MAKLGFKHSQPTLPTFSHYPPPCPPPPALTGVLTHLCLGCSSPEICLTCSLTSMKIDSNIRFSVRVPWKAPCCTSSFPSQGYHLVFTMSFTHQFLIAFLHQPESSVRAGLFVLFTIEFTKT